MSLKSYIPCGGVTFRAEALKLIEPPSFGGDPHKGFFFRVFFFSVALLGVCCTFSSWLGLLLLFSDKKGGVYFLKS